MKRHSFRLAVLCATAVLNLFNPTHARADATAFSQLSFTNLVITPGGGTFQLLANWQSSAFAQGGVSNQYNSAFSASTATATGDYSQARGSAAPGSGFFGVSGSGSATASILGQIEASDAAVGRGAVVDTFRITGGSGSVNVLFSTLINGSLNLLTDNYGQSADAETVFTLQVDGNPILFNDQVLTIGPNQNAQSPFSTLLSNTVTLQYNTVYQIYIEADAEAFASNIPEPGLGAIFAVGALMVIGLRRKRALRLFREGKARTFGLAAGAFLIFFPATSKALYIGADAKDVCQTCGYAGIRQSGGTITMSLTEGNLREDYPVVSLQSGSGPALQMSLTYNSYNADASRAQVNCGLGLGWTHSYNIFLFVQRGSLFRMGPDGRVTMYREGAGNTYTADSGFFETLTPLGGGGFAITNKQQSWWIFAAVPNTPFLVAGPVYRLIQMGDRNTNVTSLTYSNGLLTQITDAYGRSMQLVYTNQNLLATITDPLGRTTQMQYDSKYRTPVRITDPAGNVVRYSYNALYQMNRKIDRDGRTYLYLYKNQKPFAVVDGNGQTWFAESNTNNWAVDRNALAFTLRRVYMPSTVTNTDGHGNKWLYQYDTNGYVTRLTAPDGATTSYAYDSRARLLSAETNANGAVTRYQYDTMGNRTNTTDALGNVTTYTYEPVFNQMTSLTDPNGRTTTYQYDSRGNRTNEVDALGRTTRYTYDGRGNLLTQTYPLGRTTTYYYDSFGNRTNTTDALGNVTTYTYDPIGNRVSTTDPLGRTTRYQYDSLDRVIGTTNALGGVTPYTYDARGRQTSVTDPNTNTTTQVYDVRGRMVQTTDALGGVVRFGYDANDNQIATTNELGRSTTYAYDSRNRVVGTTNALGGVTRYTYDPVGNQISSTDPNNNTTTYAYDALNRQITMTDALGGVTAYDYSTPGSPPCCSATAGSALVTRMQDANGHVTFYHYDALDRSIQVIRKNSNTNDVINPGDAVTTTFYDTVGNVVAETDPVNHTTLYTYDTLNRQTNSVNAAGDTTITRYDPVGNRISETDPNTNTTTYVYDALDRLIVETDPLGGVTTAAYDADGNVIGTSDGLGHTTTYYYDGLSRRTTEIDSLGRTTTTAYDAVGNVITTIDPLTRITAYTYDALDRRIVETDPLGGMTTTAYDAVGNVITNGDANAHATTYTYDALNRRTAEIYLDSPRAVTNSYDAVGNLISRTDQNGRLTTYAYSALDLRTNKNDTFAGINDNLTYDPAGRLTAAERDGWLVTYAYDAADRVTNTTQSGFVTSYTYDIPGRTRTTTYPSGRTITEAYDGRDRLLTVHDGTPNPPIATYIYDAADRVTTRAYRNGTAAIYTYDSEDRATNIDHAPFIAGFTYAYDQNGNKLYEQKRHNPVDSEAYSYDSLNRLTNFNVGTLSGGVIPAPTLQKGWALDPVGNWISIASNGVPEFRTYDFDNELLTINGQPLFYDNDGRVTQDLAYAYTYDEDHHLTRAVRLSDSAVVGQYFYDALGRRIVQITNPTNAPATNVFFYDGSRIIEQRDGGGNLVATYTYGNYVDELLTMDRSGQTYYYHQNALWSPHALTDSGGNVVERYTYDVYGQVSVLNASYSPLPLNSWGTPHSAVGNSWLFTGRQLDEETGLYFYRARYYDSLKGRFLQRDPLEYDESMNLYEYVQSSPANGTDPDGLADAKMNDDQKKKAIEEGKKLADKFFEDIKGRDINLLQDVDNAKLIEAAAKYKEVRDYIKDKFIKEVYPKMGTYPKPGVAQSRLKDLFNGIKGKLDDAKDKDADKYSWKSVLEEAEKARKAAWNAQNPPGTAKGPGKGDAPKGTAKGPGACACKEDAASNGYKVFKNPEKEGEREILITITGAKDADGLINGWREVIVTWKKDLGSPLQTVTIWVRFKNGVSVLKDGEQRWVSVGSGKWPVVRSVSIVNSPGAAKGPGQGDAPAGTAKGPGQGNAPAGTGKGP